ncbi:MAG: RNA polymerase subunit sigma-24 [Isosphaera sp.]|nr:RNA polymerase subunit sigma-24 [Isosphaera sp.]
MTDATRRTDVRADEAELVARLQAGDGGAYAELFRAHAGAMLAVARRFFGDADAADAVQDAFVSAFRAMPGFAGAARLGTWLHRITVNACLLKLRARKRSRLVPLDGLVLARAPADRASATDETGARVRACVDRLPDAYRTVIRLRDLEELDTDATAARLGTSAGVVKTRLHRARLALRALLDPDLAEAG